MCIGYGASGRYLRRKSHPSAVGAYHYQAVTLLIPDPSSPLRVRLAPILADACVQISQSGDPEPYRRPTDNPSHLRTLKT